MAERGGFELPEPFQARPLSRRVQSTTLPPLRGHFLIVHARHYLDGLCLSTAT